MKTVALLIAIATSSAWATGESVQVRMSDFQLLYLGRYSMILDVIGPDESLWGCRRLTIRGGYSFWRWKVWNRNPTAPTWEEHKVALQKLAAINRPFIFETVGEGLKQTDESCVFVSEGLNSHSGTGGYFSVMSFYRNS